MTFEEIKQGEETYIMHTYGRFPIALDHGKGATLWDTDGKKYIDFSHSGCIDQLLCYLHHRLGVIQVAGVHQLMCLLRYRSRQRLVVMAKTVDTDARGQINVFLSVRIPQRRAFSVIQRNRKTSVCVHNIS